jgi:hypothetical protein
LFVIVPEPLFVILREAEDLLLEPRRQLQEKRPKLAGNFTPAHPFYGFHR